MLQIKSVDYVDQHGKEYDSSRLPGYAGVSGLDVDPAVLNQQKAEETGQDIESVRPLSLCNVLASLRAYFGMDISGTHVSSSLLYTCMLVCRNGQMLKRQCCTCHVMIPLTSSTQLCGLFGCRHSRVHPQSCTHIDAFCCMIITPCYALVS